MPYLEKPCKLKKTYRGEFVKGEASRKFFGYLEGEMKHNPAKREGKPLPNLEDSFHCISKAQSVAQKVKEGKGGGKQVFLKVVQCFCVEIFLHRICFLHGI